jgi:hypothetical protein
MSRRLGVPRGIVDMVSKTKGIAAIGNHTPIFQSVDNFTGLSRPKFHIFVPPHKKNKNPGATITSASEVRTIRNVKVQKEVASTEVMLIPFHEKLLVD